MRVSMVVLAVLGAALGCGDAVQPRPKAYIPPAIPSPPAQPKPLTPQPWLGCAASPQQVYEEAVPIYSYNGGSVSAYTLCADGRFDLGIEGGSLGRFDALGTYVQSDSIVVFQFNWQPWEATAKLRGDTMIVEYNSTMIGADFMNGPYTRQPPP